MSKGNWQINATDFGFEKIHNIEGNLRRRFIELQRCQEMQCEMAVERFYGMPLAKVMKYPRCQAIIQGDTSRIEDINSGTVICQWSNKIEHHSAMNWQYNPRCLEVKLSFEFYSFDSVSSGVYHP